jgi:NAD(P)-dependent dehydrogenase (short-subunit alcohol dehydrogenase family)
MTDASLEGQVALVTGGGKGIGRSIALHLAARGAKVVVTGRDERALAHVVGEIAYGGGKARHLAGDVRDHAHLAEAVGRCVDELGGLSIVVANAGQSGRVPLSAQGAEDLARARAIMETNLLGAYYTFSRAAMRMKGPGRLIALSSVLGKFGVPGYAAYCASKAALHGLVRATALELGSRGITANAVVPGWVDTEMSEAGLLEIAAATGKTRDEAKAAAVAQFPLGRFLDVEEVAGLVCFLCTKAADGITGQAISICGGQTAFGT